MRITDELRDRLSNSAIANNRSISKEVEARLEATFHHQDDPTETFLRVVRAQIEDLEARAGASWLVEREAWATAKQIVVGELDKRAPLFPEALEVANANERLQQELRTALDLAGLTKGFPTSTEPADTRSDGRDIDAVASAQKLYWQVQRARDARAELDDALAVLDAALRSASPTANIAS